MVQNVIVAVVAVVVLDWIIVGRFAANFTDFDYRYWPPSWPRIIALALVVITAIGSAIILTPGDMPPWTLIAWAIVFGIWMVVAIYDVARQRQLGYRTPPRYSEPDD